MRVLRCLAAVALGWVLAGCDGKASNDAAIATNDAVSADAIAALAPPDLIPSNPVFALPCVERERPEGGWSSINMKLPAIELGDLEIGAPVSRVESFEVLQSGCENQQGDCVFRSPSGVTYEIQSDRIFSINADGAVTREDVVLPLGMTWGSSMEQTLSRLCGEHADRWVVRTDGGTVIGMAQYQYAGKPFLFGAILFFRGGTLQAIQLQEPHDYGYPP